MSVSDEKFQNEQLEKLADTLKDKLETMSAEDPNKGKVLLVGGGDPARPVFDTKQDGIIVVDGQEHEYKGMDFKKEKQLMEKKGALLGMLGQMATLSMTLGGPEYLQKFAGTKNTRHARHVADESFEKVDSSVGYIGAAQSKETGKWYSVVMQRKSQDKFASEVLNSSDGEDVQPYEAAATSNIPFDTPMEAKLDASKQFPLMPVISDDLASFDYPYYGNRMQRAAENKNKAAEKQRNKYKKLAKGYKK